MISDHNVLVSGTISCFLVQGSRDIYMVNVNAVAAAAGATAFLSSTFEALPHLTYLKRQFITFDPSPLPMPRAKQTKATTVNTTVTRPRPSTTSGGKQRGGVINYAESEREEEVVMEEEEMGEVVESDPTRYVL